MKKAEKDLGKKLKQGDGKGLSRQKTPLLKQHSIISPHQAGAAQSMQLTGGYSHQHVQSAMNKQKKSLQLETLNVKKSDGAQFAADRNASAKEPRDHAQLPMERVRESSVHVILKQHSKNNLLVADHGRERLRDRSQR